MNKSILFVDDEQDILSALKRLFFDLDFETYFANGANEAFKILEKEKIDMVVSDIKMPEINGLDFLKYVRRKYPSIIRIVISGYAEKEVMLKVVVGGVAKSYICKPWDNDSLISEINHIFSSYESANDKSVMDIVGEIEELPVMPYVYRKILSLIEEDKGITEISHYVEKEPGYAAKILKIVNSAFYGVSTSSVKQAIVYLGLNTLKDVILSTETFNSFSKDLKDRSMVDEIWCHSALSNKILHGAYPELYKKKIPEEFASAGLLHNVGQLIFLRYFTDKYQIVYREWRKKPEKPICAMEKIVFGVCHTKLGAYLLDWWNLPSTLTDSCLYHHGPFNENLQKGEIMTLIYMADIFSWNRILKNDIIKPSDEAISILGTRSKELCTVMHEIAAKTRLSPFYK